MCGMEWQLKYVLLEDDRLTDLGFLCMTHGCIFVGAGKQAEVHVEA